MENLLPRFRAAKQLEQRDRNIIIRSAYSTIERKEGRASAQRRNPRAPVESSTLQQTLRLVAPTRRLPRTEMMKLSPYSADDPSPLSFRSSKSTRNPEIERRRVKRDDESAASLEATRPRHKTGSEQKPNAKVVTGRTSTRASTAPTLGRNPAPAGLPSARMLSKTSKEVRSTLVRFGNMSTSGCEMDVFFLGYEGGRVQCSSLNPTEMCIRRTRGVVRTKAAEERKIRTTGVNIYTGVRAGSVPEFLKSTDDSVPITVKFSNNDTVCVYEVLWLDYNGHAMRYVAISTLGPKRI